MVVALLQVLNDFIEQHGSSQGGNFFVGQYSFAEVATTPFVQRASVALLALRGYSIEKSIQQQNLQRLGAWLQASSCIHDLIECQILRVAGDCKHSSLPTADLVFVQVSPYIANLGMLKVKKSVDVDDLPSSSCIHMLAVCMVSMVTCEWCVVQVV